MRDTGPLQLKQFAAYTPGNARRAKRDGSSTRRRRQHTRAPGSLPKNHNQRDEVYAIIGGQVVSWDTHMTASMLQPDVNPTTQVVTATIDGQIQTWLNNWFGSTPTPVAASDSTTLALHTTAVPKTALSSAVPTTSSSAPDKTSNLEFTSSDSFSRIGYYNSVQQILDNLVFLGNHGGQGSGVWDKTYGSSLSYADSTGTGAAASPQVLAGATLPSDAEVMIMLAEECKSGSCGYVRPGSVAYHGFNGADKVFLIEFGMPHDDSVGFNSDMPSIWLLNAQIPRTLQYGNPECSCWVSGCGEFDVAESLNAGSDLLKSAIHTNHPGGDPNYFKRPTSGTSKLAVIFSSESSSIRLQVLPADYEFPTTLTSDAIKSLIRMSSSKAFSRFTIA
ncbi:target of Sbf [Clarireedia jacksonii]